MSVKSPFSFSTYAALRVSTTIRLLSGERVMSESRSWFPGNVTFDHFPFCRVYRSYWAAHQIFPSFVRTMRRIFLISAPLGNPELKSIIFLPSRSDNHAPVAPYAIRVLSDRGTVPLMMPLL